jgi:hypothetical protein
MNIVQIAEEEQNILNWVLLNYANDVVNKVKDLIQEKLWKSFCGNDATKWGNDHERHAKESFLNWLLKPDVQQNLNMRNISFIEENLMKFCEEPWMGVSPDGILQYDRNGTICYDLVEFKCPAYLRHSRGHPYAKHSRNTPPHYVAQIQGIMGYVNRHHETYNFQRCWFVVWQPQQTWITLHPFDEEYYSKIHQKLQSWYFNGLLPAFTHQHNGVLEYGQIFPQTPIE